MFKKKIPKYSIRKLTVGAASVLIGMAFLNSNEAKADTVKTNDAENQADAAQASNKNAETASKDLDKVVVQAKNDSQVQAVAKPAEQVKDSTKDPKEDTHKVTIKYINDYTGKAIYQLTRSTNKYEYIPEFSGEFKDGQAIGIDHTFTNKYGSYTATTRPFIYNDIAGFKLLNYDDIAKTFSQVTSNGGAIMTGDKDIELALHYAPLSDTYIRHVDENGKPKANKVIATANNNNVVLTEYFLFYQYKLYRPYDPYG